MAHAHIGFLGGQAARRIDFGGVREAFHVRPHLMPGRRFFLNCFFARLLFMGFHLWLL